MDFAFTDAQRELYDSVRTFARQQIHPTVLQREPLQTWNDDIWQKLAGMGLLGAPIPEEYGGTGLSCVETCLVKEAFGAGAEDGGVALAWGAHTILCGVPIWKLGTEDQKRRYLPGMCDGSLIGGFCLSEPDSGSDAAGMKTRAVRKGDRWILNGRKMWITNGPIGGVFVVTAVTDPDARPRAAGISTFLVESGFPGFSVGQHIDKMGMKTSVTSELVFDDCEVPAENLLGMENYGFIITAKLILGWERSCLLAPGLGGMDAAIERCARYQQERHQFGRPIARFQAMRHMLADMKVKVELARNLIYRVAWKLDQDGDPPLVDAAIAKVFLSEASQQVFRDAVQIHGGNGFTTEYHVERGLRDSMLSTIGAGTSEIQRGIIARAILDLPF
ncbi:MAG: acyl-CoA dehydrogenase family protein [Alphaproteobacteria bacterium]|nr:acyl-CoA dehydrogenase family protein [Alphaproteobacteria bacterium]